jgi:hypothetical protein
MKYFMFLPQFDGLSSWVRPPHTWNVFKINYVFLWTHPPQVGGEWCSHVGVYFLGYTQTTGKHTVRELEWDSRHHA